jgi:hypothetical protein
MTTTASSTALPANRTPAADLRLQPLSSGSGPARMTPVTLPNNTVHATRTPAPLTDTYTPTNSPASTPAGTPPTPIAPPTFRPLPGALRMRSLHAETGPPTMAPLAPSTDPLRMSPLGDPAPAPAAPGKPAAPSAAGFAAPTFGKGLDAQRSFSEALGAAARSDAIGERLNRPEEAKAREAAEKLISTTLVEPILKQLRDSNNAAPPFGATPAEKQFGSLLDHRLSQDIVKSANFPIVDRVARDLLRNRGDSA